jgi:hypothetical protein
MQFSKTISLAAFIGLSVLFLGNSGGRAAISNVGNTGAFGDELNINGTFRTCQSCHNTGPITCSMTLELVNQFQQVITTYEPGKTYILRVSINSTSGNVAGYGFQMIGLRKQGNVDTKGFRDPGVNNYHLATISNGRTYAEHNANAFDPVFPVTWVAPAYGTGTVKFYASGTAVNGNDIPAGDGAAVATLEVTEMTSATNNPAAQEVFTIKPVANPVSALGQEVQFRVEGIEFGVAQCAIYDLAGQQVHTQQVQINQSNFALAGVNLTNGLYVVGLNMGTKTALTKLIIQD